MEEETTLLYPLRKVYLCKERVILCQKNTSALFPLRLYFSELWEAARRVGQMKDIFSHGCYLCVVQKCGKWRELPFLLWSDEGLYFGYRTRLRRSPQAMWVVIPQTDIHDQIIHQTAPWLPFFNPPKSFHVCHLFCIKKNKKTRYFKTAIF